MRIYRLMSGLTCMLLLMLTVGCGTVVTPLPADFPPPPGFQLTATLPPSISPTTTPIVAQIIAPSETPYVAAVIVRGIAMTFTPAPPGSNVAADKGNANPEAAIIAEGDRLFHTTGTCYSCHDVSQGVRIVGPSLKGIASRAEQRIPGKTAAEYIRATILKPDQVVLDGYPTGVMPSNLGTLLTSDEIDAVVTYLLSL